MKATSEWAAWLSYRACFEEVGGDPIVILPRAGLETSALDDVENRIPYVSMGRLFRRADSSKSLDIPFQDEGSALSPLPPSLAPSC
jgi:hypothetical protein